MHLLGIYVIKKACYDFVIALKVTTKSNMAVGICKVTTFIYSVNLISAKVGIQCFRCILSIR